MFLAVQCVCEQKWINRCPHLWGCGFISITVISVCHGLWIKQNMSYQNHSVCQSNYYPLDGTYHSSSTACKSSWGGAGFSSDGAGFGSSGVEYGCSRAGGGVWATWIGPAGAAFKFAGCMAVIKFAGWTRIRGIGTGCAEDMKRGGAWFCGAGAGAAWLGRLTWAAVPVCCACESWSWLMILLI